MGVVYRASDLSLKRQVAIKTLPRLTPQHAAQLEREAQAMASLNHTNLAVIYGIESWRGTPFLVEEYLAGGTLADRLRGGPLAVAEALEIGIALAGVLAQLHASGIVHRDIKPSNIGFSQTGVVKLVDFGIAHLLQAASSLETSTWSERDHSPAEGPVIVTKPAISGTPAYMSPEAARGAAAAPGFDLWSLSVVLFEAIAGQRPFSGRNAGEVLLGMTRGPKPHLASFRPDCPAEVAGFFDRSLAVEIERRPRTAAAMHAELLALKPLVT
jgi:serine/threonine-protein kinase